MAELLPEILEKILITLDVKDLISCKSVCKSWKSFITCPHFIQSHLNYNIILKNSNYGKLNKKPLLVTMNYYFKFSYRLDDLTFDFKECRFLGTCNGLVCISLFEAQVLVVNPSTREVRKLIKPKVYMETKILFSGFGYDTLLDDYKVVLGFKKGEKDACFKTLTLKTNVWKDVGEMKYGSFKEPNVGTLCNGALHWLLEYENGIKEILCFDLCKEEFKLIPQPARYELNDATFLNFHTWFIGTLMLDMDEYLSIFRRRGHCYQVWVMKKYNVKESWELMSDVEYDIPYFGYYAPLSFPMTSEDVRASVFVQSLISPYPQGTLKRKRQMMMIRKRDDKGGPLAPIPGARV